MAEQYNALMAIGTWDLFQPQSLQNLVGSEFIERNFDLMVLWRGIKHIWLLRIFISR